MAAPAAEMTGTPGADPFPDGRAAPAAIPPVRAPGAFVRALYAIGRRRFGRVPTPATLMAHRPTLMVGLGAFWAALEYGGTLDARLRALVQLEVARLRRSAY